MTELPIDAVPTITKRVMYVIGISTVLGIIYDVIAYIFGGNNATLSKAMQQIGFSWPIVLVVYGILASHFFCPDDKQWTGWWPESKPYALIIIGMVVGRLAWPQVTDPAKTIMGALGKQP